MRPTDSSEQHEPLDGSDLAQRLEDARGILLAALTGLGERDFAADAGGLTVTQLLANLAAAESEAIRAARAAVGLAPRPTATGGGTTSRPLPPQATHALAATRFEARRLIEELGAAPVPTEVARLLLDGVAAPELEAAVRIGARVAAQ